MHDLQLVGFTTDRRGLIFRTATGARAESFVVPVTAELLAAVNDLAVARDVDVPSDVEEAPAPETVAAAPRPTSSLPVREIQARLRTGETPARVAAEAGVDEEWIERFAPPVRAEQRRIVERALDAHLRKARGGPSAVPLRRAVGMAMAERGVAFTVAGFEAAWSARLLGQDRWEVDFAYRHRGQRSARWVYDAAADELTTSDRSAAQLGHVPETAKLAPDAGVPIDGVVGDPSATPIGVPEPPAPRAAKRKPRSSRGSTKTTGGARPATAKATRTAGPAGKRSTGKKAAATKVGTNRRTSTTKAASTTARPAGRVVSGTGRAAAKKAVKATPTRATAKASTAKRATTPKKAQPTAKRASSKAAGSKRSATRSGSGGAGKKGSTSKAATTRSGGRAAEKAPAPAGAETRSANGSGATPRAGSRSGSTSVKAAVASRRAGDPAPPPTPSVPTSRRLPDSIAGATPAAREPSASRRSPDAIPSTAAGPAPAAVRRSPDSDATGTSTTGRSPDAAPLTPPSNGATRRRAADAGGRGRRTAPDTGGRVVAARPGEVHLDEVPLAAAPAPAGNGRPAALDRVPAASDVVDTTAPDRPGALRPVQVPARAVDHAGARRARAAERAGPTVRFRDGSATPVRRAEGDGAASPPRRRGQLRAR